MKSPHAPAPHRKLIVRRNGVTYEGWIAARQDDDLALLRRDAALAMGIAARDLAELVVDRTEDAVIFRPWAVWG